MSAPPARRVRLRVPAELDGERLDRGLARLVRGHSRARLREMVEDGRVRVDGERATRPARTLAAGQELEVELRERDRSRPGSRPGLDFELLHTDEAVIVVAKPAGMVVHPSSTVRGGTLSERLVQRFGPLPGPQGADRPGIVHRLDADTSGVLVAARTEAAAASLLAQFRERRVEKTYLALVHGEPRFDSDWIEAPLARPAAQGGRVGVVGRGQGAAKGKDAATFYSVVERFSDFALLACRPVTGRTHQIRAHLASIGHPLLGDALYREARGTRHVPWPAAAPSVPRQALHSAVLAFTHPLSGERVRFEAPWPEDLRPGLEWLRAGRPGP